LTEEAVGRDDRDREDHRHAAEEAFEVLRLGSLEDVEQQAHGLAHVQYGAAPTALETELAQVGFDLRPRRRVRPPMEELEGLRDRAPQIAHLLEARVEHELPAALLMELKKAKERLVSFAEVDEEPAREVAVQELDAPSDRLRLLETRELAIERGEVDLDLIGLPDAGLAGDEIFAEGEVLGGADHLRGHLLDVEAHEEPTPDLRPHGEDEPRLRDRGLLTADDELAQPLALVPSVVGKDRLEAIPDLRLKKERFREVGVV